VVTVCQLRRHLELLAALFTAAPAPEAGLSPSVATWLRETNAILESRVMLLSKTTISDEERRALLDALQAVFERYRLRAYSSEAAASAPFPLREAAALCALGQRYLEATVRQNRRPDRLYHSYNLLTLVEEPRAARVANLYEMLEGQVAALASGLLDSQEALGLLDALFESKMYRPDQQSFMLYPDRELPGFLAKNQVPADEVQKSPLLSALLAAQDRTILAKDVFGIYRFDGDFQTSDDVQRALDGLGGNERFSALVKAHAHEVVDLFVRVFDLKSFTGRSGTMYGYEGLGCIYWHMVSKLLLAVQELHTRALERDEDPVTLQRLARAYHRVRRGLGFNKTAREFGAFPTDPYSHTPKHSGAQQPGMTGLVKEELLARLGELGVLVREGCLEFRPALLRPHELLSLPTDWDWFGADGVPRRRTLLAGELGFTLCQTPIVYRLAQRRSLLLRTVDGEERELAGSRLDAAASDQILGRSGEVLELLVSITSSDLCQE